MSDIDTTNAVHTVTPPADLAEQVNADTIRARARTALDANATFLAITSPTNAQTLAQVKALTRQINAVIKLLVRGDMLLNTDGT